MKLAIASDHAGVELKAYLKAQMEAYGHHFEDFGTHTTDSCDYPDYAHPAAEAVENGTCELGILICGSANGVCMTANKHQGIRAALVWNTEVAELARQHNDANMICLPARFLSQEEALTIVMAWLNATYEGGRHQRRVDKIPV
ncbi:MAG: ribose 5-phosphate isomerase B [Bacteroidetes bacterium]|nr:MAG: ribose 5-phosphate isomerase B [Bacteroidota bacterium]